MVRDLLREYRLASGLTQAAVAEMISVDVSTVSRWERGLVSPSIADLARVRALLSDPIEAVRSSPIIAAALRVSDGIMLATSYAGAEARDMLVSDLEGVTYRPPAVFSDVDHRQAVERCLAAGSLITRFNTARGAVYRTEMRVRTVHGACVVIGETRRIAQAALSDQSQSGVAACIARSRPDPAAPSSAVARSLRQARSRVS